MKSSTRESGNSPSFKKLSSDKRFVRRNNSMLRKVSRKHEKGILRVVLGKLITLCS